MAFDINSLVTDRAEADVAALEALEAVSLDQWTAEQLAEFNRSRSKGVIQRNKIKEYGKKTADKKEQERK